MIPLFKPWVGKEEIEAVAEVINSGWLGVGPKTQEFEEKFAEYVGADYAIAVNSGTAALDIAIKALGIKSGEILVPSLTFAATANVALYNNAKPVFVDIDEDTNCMSIEDAKRKFTEDTKAIIPVHYGGHPCDMDEFIEFAQRKEIPIIEDAAHAAGAEYNGKKIGSVSDITCFSFHPVKNMATGDGGMVTTNDEKVYQAVKKLRWFCINKSTFERAENKKYSWYYEIDGLGYKYHMNDITAAIGLVQLKKLDKANELRRNISSRYMKAFSDLGWVKLPVEKPNVKSSWHMFVPKVKNRDGLIEHLGNNGISAGVHYLPVHMHPYFEGLIKEGRINRPDTPVTDTVWKNIITLPLFPGLADAELEKIVASVREFKPE
ncbi:MAG: DegT/DnrJ/EryC1/StrS family aminotransferase [Candidatus Aenigmarchaeota archaeon]|nr:DegT/DnrJ/EryC1/StrS family aminotransferase [Candidatus Aenigmarchaeota archaeon]